VLSGWVLHPLMLEPPSLNATVPVGVPEPEATVALITTGPLKTDGLGLGTGLRVVVVAMPLTTCVTVFDVLVAKLLSPLYTALTECEPGASAEVEQVAVPVVIGWAPQLVMFVLPSLNATVPVGEPASDETVAVNNTASPAVDGLVPETSAVLDDARLTFWVSVGEVLVVKSVSPP
jgi:hypothetical protein